jgi:GNAT superfamily N-acetyltransferase
VAIPTELNVHGRMFGLRRATVDDVAAIVALLVDDPLGRTRERPAIGVGLVPYLDAFAAIDTDPNQLLVVVVQGAEVQGTMQLTFIQGMSRSGALRAMVEAVRVVPSQRGQGLGGEMMRWAVSEARHRGCVLVQLTSDKSRLDAHRFYERLGFVSTHEGMKLVL